MEKIKEFLRVETGYGSGYGSGDGYGSSSGYGSGDGYGSSSGDGYGDGDGDGDGRGRGYGSGYGDGDGDGDGYGYGYGSSYGSSYGYGYGSGYGSGYGYGDGEDISFFDGMCIYNIDGISTAITHLHRNIAKGYILNDDFTLTPCYVAKGQNKFAHGGTAEEAIRSLEEKIFKNLDVEEKISVFLEQFNDLDKKYPARSFYEWHNKLTGSCEMGRQQFARQGGYDLENDMFTVEEFISITRNAYGKEVIGQLEGAVKERIKTEGK